MNAFLGLTSAEGDIFWMTLIIQVIGVSRLYYVISTRSAAGSPKLSLGAAATALG
jgi:hypothetical protein